MKIPLKPPDFNDLLTKSSADSPENLARLLSLGIPPDDPGGKYYHWDKLRRLKLPAHVSRHEQWWLAVKFARRALYKKIAHSDKGGKPFLHAEPDVVHRLLHEIDIHGGGELKATEQVKNPATRDTYLINSLIEEAITSSQLEGAATTRKVAKEMLRTKRKPLDISEIMIVNNYRAMEFIKEVSDEDMTPKLICELHKVITTGTLKADAVGQLRTSDDIIVGDGRDATTLHIPPKAKELAKRIQGICNFANAVPASRFLHPVVRAIILHFLLAYDHPFEDGNGRTARALFYWSMMKQGYWTMEFVSISRILKLAPAKYSRAYLYTETDDNDVTYFIVYQLEVIKRAINDLLDYLKRKADEIKTVESLVRKSPRLQKLLNHRQVALIHRALKTPESVFSVDSHRGAHNVTYDTARTDLLKLTDLKLLEKAQIGKAFVFSPVSGLKRKLETLK